MTLIDEIPDSWYNNTELWKKIKDYFKKTRHHLHAIVGITGDLMFYKANK
jgi:hypothetical protein